MSERPGPDVGKPKRQHQIMAMLWLLSTSQNRREARSFLAGLEAVVEEEWGWDEYRLKVELANAQRVMIEYQGRLTFWFKEGGGMEYDYNCTPPKQ